MIVRRLSPADVSEYRRLRLFGLRESPSAFGSSYVEESKRTIQFFASRLEHSDDKWTFGALVGKRLVGVVTLMREASLKARHKAGIYGMYVSPRWRKKGIGRELLACAIDIARQLHGVKQLYLAVGSSNRPALHLYESLGFQSYGEEPRALVVGRRYYSETLLVLPLRSKRPSPAARSA